MIPIIEEIKKLSPRSIGIDDLYEVGIQYKRIFTIPSNVSTEVMEYAVLDVKRKIVTDLLGSIRYRLSEVEYSIGRDDYCKSISLLRKIMEDLEI